MNPFYFPFSKALEALKDGHRITRATWRVRRISLTLRPGSMFTVATDVDGQVVQYESYIDMTTIDGTTRPWSPSPADLIADDWMIAVKERTGGAHRTEDWKP